MSTGVVYLSQTYKHKRRRVDSPSLQPESDLLRALRALHDTSKSDSPQTLRYSCDGKQELAFQHNTLVWSRGSSIYRVFTTNDKIIDAAFVSFKSQHHSTKNPSKLSRESKSSDAAHRQDLMGLFADPTPSRWEDEEGSRANPCPSTDKTKFKHALCIAHRDALQIHFDDGTESALTTPWPISRVWPVGEAQGGGLLVQRKDSKRGTNLYSLHDITAFFSPVRQDLPIDPNSDKIVSVNDELIIVVNESSQTLSILGIQPTSSSSSSKPSGRSILNLSHPHENTSLRRSNTALHMPQQSPLHFNNANPQLPQNHFSTRNHSSWNPTSPNPNVSFELLASLSQKPTQVQQQPQAQQLRSSLNRSTNFLHENTSVHQPPRASEHSVMAREADDTIIWDDMSQNLADGSVIMATESDYSAERIWDGHIQSLDSNLLVTIFDRSENISSTSASSFSQSFILAILLRSTSNLLLFRLQRSISLSSGWKCKPLRTMSATSIEPVLATRSFAGICDLFVRLEGSYPTILTKDAIPIECHCHDPVLQIPPGPTLDILQALSCSSKMSNVTLAEIITELYAAPSFDIAYLEDILLGHSYLQNTSSLRKETFEHLASVSFADRIFQPLISKSFTLKSPPLSHDEKTPIPRISLDDLLVIHLLYEDLRLTSDRLEIAYKVGRIAAHLVLALARTPQEANIWIERYSRDSIDFDIPSKSSYLKPTSSTPSSILSNPPPNLYKTITNLLFHQNDLKPPFYPTLSAGPDSFFGTIEPLHLTKTVLSIMKDHFNQPVALVSFLCKLGWSSDQIDRLGFGVAVAIREVLRTNKLSTPPSTSEYWGPAEFDLIGREDLAMQIDEKRCANMENEKHLAISLFRESTKMNVSKNEDIQHQRFVTRFGADLRVSEVEGILESDSRVTLRVSEKRGISEYNLSLQHQALVNAVSNRTLALPMGQGSFYYRSMIPDPHQPVPIPSFNFEVRLLPDDSLWNPETTFLTPERSVWPEFHIGVATGLKIVPQPDRFDSAELALNRPIELNSKHAGFLLGLGLNQSLRSLAVYQAYTYLDSKHEETSIGLLLGLAAAFAGTGDKKIMSILTVHLSALHPPSSIPLNVPLLTQAAGLLGLGILNIGKGKRSLADTVLKELRKITIVGVRPAEDCREAYALAGGFAFGMIMLGKGPELLSLNSFALENFKVLLQGGDEGSGGDGNTNQQSQNAAIDVEVTSPAATMALGLAFFRHEESAEILDLLEIPSTSLGLDYIRPDLILMRSLSRCLIQWNLVEASEVWIESRIPSFISDQVEHFSSSFPSIAIIDIEVAYWNIIAGTCLAVGIKFAGTAHEDAHTAFIGYVDRLIKTFSHKGQGLQHKLKMASLRNCISVLLIALATLMAGSGELHVLRRLRMFHGQVGDPLDYGSHLATHLAIGLLFLGGGRYTLSSSPASIAFLVCAFFPVLPLSPSDNRIHLQAARHLWALAVEPRCLLAKDVSNGEIVYLPVKLRIRENASKLPIKVENGRQLEKRSSNGDTVISQHLVCPTLIPGISSIERVRIDTPRYWPITLDLRRNEAHRQRLLQSRVLFVKRRAGHLSYLDDARGNQSVFTRSKVEAGAIVLNCSKTAGMMLASSAAIPGLRHFLSALSPDVGMAGAIRFLIGLDRSNNSSGNNNDTTALAKEHIDVQMNGFQAFCASVLMECLTQDKNEMIPFYQTIYLGQLSRTTRSLKQHSKIMNFFCIQGIENLNILFALYDNFNQHSALFTSRQESKGSTSGGRPTTKTLINRVFLESVFETFHDVASVKAAVHEFVEIFWTGGISKSEATEDLFSTETRVLLAMCGCPSAMDLHKLSMLVRSYLKDMQAQAAVTNSSDMHIKTMLSKTIELLLRKSFEGMGIRTMIAGVLATACSENFTAYDV